MSGQTQTFRVRPAAENGGRDTLSVAAEALLQGSGLPITRANVNVAIRDIAAANGLQPVRIVQRVNATTDQQQVTIYGAGGRVLMQGRWHTPAGNPDFAPEPGTGRNIYDCEWIEYRSQGGRRAIQPGDELREPPQAKYQGFGPGGPQIVSDCVTCVTPPPEVTPPTTLPPPPAPTPPAPPPPPPERELRESGATYYQRQDSASQDGTNWRPGTQIHALESLARSGLIPEFTSEWYTPQNIAARHPVVAQRDTGGVGGSVLGHENGDHLTQGSSQFGIGEDAASRGNDGNARRRGTTGRGGVVGQMIDGPRVVGFIPGHAAQITNDGTYVRAEDMPFQWAYGGNYAYQIFGRNIPLPIPSFLPVGGLGTSPQTQIVLNAETQRYGISLANPLHAAVNEAGYDNAFRDQQAMHGSPLESPDRVYALMFGANAQRVRNESLVAFDREQDPARRQELAVQVLVAHRDLSENLLVRQVDSLRLPMQRDQEGIANYLASQGVDIAAAQAAAAQAPRLQVQDMPAPQLESLRNYDELRDSRYANINPGETNPAYRAAEQYVYRNMNHLEQALANADVTQVPEADLLRANHAAALALTSTQGGNVAFAQAMENNDNIAQNVVNLLRDMPRNPTAYGFANPREALAYTRTITGNDGQARAEIERNGGTAMLPVIGRDDPFGGANPDQIVPLISARIRENPAFFTDLMTRATDPALGTDAQGRTDGRPYGVGIFSAFSAERGATAQGAVAPQFATVSTALGGPESEAGQLFERAARLSALTRANGTSNASSQGRERLDNLGVAGQYGRRAAAGEAVGVVGGADVEADRAALRTTAGEGTIDVYNTGRFDGAEVFEAARNGDGRAVFSALLRSQEARETGSTSVAVSGLQRYPALARDAVLATMLAEPHALNDVIASLDGLQRSTRGAKYGELADALRDTRSLALRYQETGNPRDLERAVQRYGSFFANLEASQGHRHGALRQTAWDAFLVNIGTDPAASAWVVETVARDNELSAGVIRAIPGIVAEADGQRVGHNGRATGDRSVPTTAATDDVYSSRYFQLATDDQGRVRGTGLFSHRRGAIAVNGTDLAVVLTPTTAGPDTPAAPENAPTPATGTTTPVDEVSRSLQQSGVVTQQDPINLDNALNVNPVVYTGTRGTTPVQAVSAWMQQQNIPLPPGVASFDQLAANTIDAGLVRVAESPDQLTVTLNNASLDGTINTASGLPAVAGVSLWWAALAYRNGGGNNPDTNTGQIGGCLPNCPPAPPTPPVLLPPGQPNLGP